MKKTINLWQLGGFAITCFVGTLLHFLYDWSGESIIIAPFSSINESTWEHMKLLYWPMFIFTIVQAFYFKQNKNYWCVKLRGMLLGLTLIPVLFYTYNGVIGKSPDWINIVIFFVSAAVAYFYEAMRLNRQPASCSYPKLAINLLCVIGAFFIIFTFSTPELDIFRDPTTGLCGLQ